jgi:hypothetical protein
LVSSSLSMVGQFNFQYYLLSHKISFRIHHLPYFGKLAFHPLPAVSLCDSPDLCLVLGTPLGSWLSPCPQSQLCVSPNLCWVLVAPLGDWLVTPPLLSVFVALPAFVNTESLAMRAQLLASPPFSRAGLAFHLHCQC